MKDGEIYSFGPFRVEADEQRLLKNNEPVRIPGKAFDLLLALLRSAGHLKSREALIEALWPNTIVEEANLTWNMNVLRRTLGDGRQNPRYVETVHGHGYRFIAAVESLTLATVPTVAVLPFENLATDPENTYFTAGIRNTILSKLAGISELRVISSTSTEHYPSHPADLKQVATQLNATSVLEGSVQKMGNRVLINVQLIDVQTNNHIWAQTYTHSLKDALTVENDIAVHIAAALKTNLLPAEATQLARTSTNDAKAQLLFLRASYYANQVIDRNNTQGIADTAAQAIAHYREAIDSDPRFALAWARLSRLLGYACAHEIVTSSQAMLDAEQAARQALALEPDLPEAHFAMGYIEYYAYRDYDAALARFERVRQKVPNDNEAAVAIALVQAHKGKWREALTGLRRTAAQDPLNPFWHYATGVNLMPLRRYTEAWCEFDLALAVEPADWLAAAYKAWSFMLAGKPLPQIRRALADIPRNSVETYAVVALQFEISWLNRQPEAALEALMNTPDWVSAANAIGQEPVELLRAQAWALQGDAARARQAYTLARDMLKNALLEQPENSNLWSFLGLAEAGLERKSQAIRSGLKAISLTPTSKDAWQGPSHLVTLAKIYVQINETDKALELLRKSLDLPAGGFISVPILKRDPVWNPLRKDSRFQALLKEYANKLPVPDLDVPDILSSADR